MMKAASMSKLKITLLEAIRHLANPGMIAKGNCTCAGSGSACVAPLWQGNLVRADTLAVVLLGAGRCVYKWLYTVALVIREYKLVMIWRE